MTPLRVLLVDTRQPRDTKKLVAGVGARVRQFPSVLLPTLDALHAMAVCMGCTVAPDHAADIVALANAGGAAGGSSSSSSPATVPETDPTGLPTLIACTHALMNALGVGHDKLDRVVALAAARNWPAKLTGPLNSPMIGFDGRHFYLSRTWLTFVCFLWCNISVDSLFQVLAEEVVPL